MALWFNLKINAERVGGVEIRRRESLDISDPAAIANVWSTYDVFRDDRLIGQVRHQYGHGAWRLLALASSLIANADVPPPSIPAERYRRPRLRGCVERWDGAETEGDYDPKCCRFPKSCSASVYSDNHVKASDLEGPNLGECEACTHPGALHGKEGCNAQWVQSDELRTCPCQHAGHEFSVTGSNRPAVDRG